MLFHKWLWVYSEKYIVTMKSLPAMVPGFDYFHSNFPPEFLMGMVLSFFKKLCVCASMSMICLYIISLCASMTMICIYMMCVYLCLRYVCICLCVCPSMSMMHMYISVYVCM